MHNTCTYRACQMDMRFIKVLFSSREFTVHVLAHVKSIIVNLQNVEHLS